MPVTESIPFYIYCSVCVKLDERTTPSAYIAYFRAMTEQHLDLKDDARQSLARANELADKELSDESKPLFWTQKLTLQLLRKEAEALIGRQP